MQGIQKQRIHEELKILTIVCDIVSPQLEEFIFFWGCKKGVFTHTAQPPIANSLPTDTLLSVCHTFSSVREAVCILACRHPR